MFHTAHITHGTIQDHGVPVNIPPFLTLLRKPLSFPSQSLISQHFLNPLAPPKPFLSLSRGLLSLSLSRCTAEVFYPSRLAESPGGPEAASPALPSAHPECHIPLPLLGSRYLRLLVARGQVKAEPESCSAYRPYGQT